MAESYRRRSETGGKNSGLISTDTAVFSSAGKVYWITISDTGDVEVELNDSIDNSGTDKWGIKLDASVNNIFHAVFDPPIEFSTGIYVDVTSSTALSCYLCYGEP